MNYKENKINIHAQHKNKLFVTILLTKYNSEYAYKLTILANCVTYIKIYFDKK